MEKLQTLLLILLGLGVFIWRMVRKAVENTARERRERPAVPKRRAPALPDTSFRELLKQMQAQNETPSTTVAEARPTTPGGRALPTVPAPAPRSLERTEIRPVSLEAPATARANQEQTPPIRRAATLPRATTEYNARQQARPATIASTVARPTRRTVQETIHNPADLRAAFVLSEILQRRF